MNENILDELKDLGVSEEDLQNAGKVKELAEKFELENKEVKSSKEEVKDEVKGEEESKEDKILNDQLGRLAKAISKRITPAKTQKTEAEVKSESLIELDVANKVFVEANNISEDKLKVLEEYSHLPSNKGKSFKEIAGTETVKSIFNTIDEEVKAENELDTNATEDEILNTRNEIFEEYDKTQKTPETDYEHKVVVEKDLEEMGFKEY